MCVCVCVCVLVVLPQVRNLLLNARPGAEQDTHCSSVSPSELLRALRLPEAAYRAAVLGLQQEPRHSVLQHQTVLSAMACATLRKAVDAAVVTAKKPCGIDTVDGAPDFQLNVSVDRLAELVGVEGMGTLGRIAHKFEDSQRDSADSVTDGLEDNFLAVAQQKEGVEVFIRRYSSGGRYVCRLCYKVTL